MNPRKYTGVDPTRALIARASRRRGTRGAMMTEGLIVIPAFITVFVLTTWVGSVYRAKIDTMVQSRQDAFSTASGNCLTIPTGVKIKQLDRGDIAMGMASNLLSGAPWSAIFTAPVFEVVQIKNGIATGSATMHGGPLSAEVTTETAMTCNAAPELINYVKVFMFAYAKLLPFA